MGGGGISAICFRGFEFEGDFLEDIPTVMNVFWFRGNSRVKGALGYRKKR